MNLTYLKVEELAERINFKPQTILRNKLDSVLIEHIHYVRPFGGKRVLFIWEHIERDMLSGHLGSSSVPMARGGYAHG